MYIIFATPNDKADYSHCRVVKSLAATLGGFRAQQMYVKTIDGKEYKIPYCMHEKSGLLLTCQVKAWMDVSLERALLADDQLLA